MPPGIVLAVGQVGDHVLAVAGALEGRDVWLVVTVVFARPVCAGTRIAAAGISGDPMKFQELFRLFCSM